MKTLLTLFFTCLFAFSQGQKRDVDVGYFSELSLGIPAKLYVIQGSTEKLEIECDDDIFEKIEFEMNGDRLVISNKEKWNWKNGWNRTDVTIYATMDKIESLGVSGSGTIESKGKLNTQDIKLSVSGSGDMELELNSEELDMRISGSGSISLNGNADDAEVRISGSGKVRAEDMEVKTFEASISGSGSCYITATDEIKARISGSGNVYYNGDPKRVISDSSGSGKVRKL